MTAITDIPVKANKKRDDKLRREFRNDPIRVFTQIFDVRPEFVWEKMVEVAESVRNKPFTAVKAGHAVSKSFTAARLALWFLYCHYPSTVITTAPSNDQVENILWREIRLAYANAKVHLAGHLTTTKLDLAEKWFAYGFATRPDTVTREATRFQGYHNEHILVIFDEAAGIMPQIWRAAQHLLTSGHCRWLAIGNPTSPVGEFANCFTDPAWNKITISVKDTPNYKAGREIIPGVSGRQYEQRIRAKYGEDSNEYKIRILGEFPDFAEGTYYGKEMADAAREKRIGFFPADPAAKVHTFWDIGDMHNAIWFAQFIQQEIRLVDFMYDCTGRGLPAYASMLQAKPYNYGDHFAPDDIIGSNAKSFQTGKFTIDIAKQLGIDFQVAPKHFVNHGIEAVRSILPLCRFSEDKCREGTQGLSNYAKRKNEILSTDTKPVYYNEPVRDWTRHVADAFRTLAMAYRYMRIDGERIGYPGAIPSYDDPADAGTTDLLGL